MSPFHFHRVFRAVTGVTPAAYAAADRAARRAGAATADDLESALAKLRRAGYPVKG